MTGGSTTGGASATTIMPHTEERSHALVGDGCRLAYRLDGPADAPVVVLSNSLGTALEMWTPQLPALAGRFRVLRYDGRGHGDSDAPPGGYSLDRLGRDVLELLDGLGLDRVHFCGLSLGGMLGQWLAVRAPERIDRLVLANTAAYMGPPAGWQERIDTVLRDGMGAVAEATLGRWFTAAFRERAPEVVAGVRGRFLATSVTGYAGCCAAIRDMDLRPTAPLIARPSLLVAGTADPSTPPERSDEIARAMRADARVVLLEAAHLSNVEQPREFSRAVLHFLS